MGKREEQKFAPVHMTYEWQPVVKNWFVGEFYNNKKVKREIINPHKGPNDWVFFETNAKIDVQIETEVQPQDQKYQHLINLHVKASFVPAFSNNSNKQFLSPYQDQVSVAILYTPNHNISRNLSPAQMATLGPAESNGRSYHKNTSKNKFEVGASATVSSVPSSRKCRG